MIYPAKIFFIIFSCAAAATVAAETLYKSVNEKGEVTFSDEPPANAAQVQKIQVQPAPTEQQHREGVEREQMIRQEADRLGTANAERAQMRADQAPQPSQQEPADVEPIETYNTGNYYNRRPVHPIQPVPGGRPRPTPLPSRPVQRPAR